MLFRKRAVLFLERGGKMTHVGAVARRGSLTDIDPSPGEKKCGIFLFRSVSKYCIVQHEMRYTSEPVCIILEEDINMTDSINRREGGARYGKRKNHRYDTRPGIPSDGSICPSGAPGDAVPADL